MYLHDPESILAGAVSIVGQLILVEWHLMGPHDRIVGSEVVQRNVIGGELAVSG